MSEVGIRQLKNATSSIVERVENGEVVTVTRRGRPVAHMVPAGMSPGMAQLVEEGVVRWSGRRMRLPRDPAPLIGEGPTAADYVSEGRR